MQPRPLASRYMPTTATGSDDDAGEHDSDPIPAPGDKRIRHSASSDQLER